MEITEDHPKFEAFIRAFWRRIEPYKNKHGKELPGEMPVEFKASMATALLIFDRNDPVNTNCPNCLGKGYTESYFDAGDHFGAGTSPFSEWIRKPCKSCKATGKA